MITFIEAFPQLVHELHPTQNCDLDLTKLTPFSHKKAWWVCPQCMNVYEAEIASRSRGRGCPYCAGRKVLPGFNDLATKNPKLAKEWNADKNGGLTPSTITEKSNKLVWWQCSVCGYEWKAAVYSRAAGNGCPHCYKKRLSEKAKTRNLKSGENDLQTLYPEIAEEWHPNKNGKLTAGLVTAHSNKKVWWLCKKCNYEWKATVDHRTNGRGCPICSRKSAADKLTKKNLIPGTNDLVTLYPEIAVEWDYDKNSDTPGEYSPFSTRRRWWKCVQGHSFEQVIANRTSQHQGCPICSKEFKTSFPEQALLFYLKDYYPNLSGQDRSFGFELDVFLPTQMTAVEYDGAYWHKSKNNNDTRKSILCQEKGIKLIRVRENGLEPIEGCINIPIGRKCSDDDLNKMIIEVFDEIDSTLVTDINVSRDRSKIYSNYINTLKKNSLLISDPELAKEWNYDKNGNLKPDMVSANSHKKVWWKCKYGHEWDAVIKNRYLNGNNCPLCRKNNYTGPVKAVRCIETDSKFESIKSAAEYYGVNAPLISACLHGHQKTAGGYHWEFI